MEFFLLYGGSIKKERNYSLRPNLDDVVFKICQAQILRCAKDILYITFDIFLCFQNISNIFFKLY